MNKELKSLIESNCSDLENSAEDFESIYNIMFRQADLVIAETDDGFRTKEYTYEDLKKMIESASGGLYSAVGATHGYIGLEMENCVEWIAAFWAILRSGNKPFLINCRHPKELSDGIIRDLGIKYIVGLNPTALNAQYIDFRSIADGDASFAGEFENEIALSTSATTLNEVVCFYTGSEISNQILNARTILSGNRRMAEHCHGSLKQLAFLPFYHVFGLIAVYFWFTYFGRTLVFLRDYSPDTIVKTCRKHEVTHIFAVPMFWHTIEKQVMREISQKGQKTEKRFARAIGFCTFIQNVMPYLGTKLSVRFMKQITGKLFGSSVRFCISGGSSLRDSALRLFNGLGYPMHNGFGMSEIGITSVELRSRPAQRNENSVGRPFSSVEYRISERGTLLVRGTSISHRMMVNGQEQHTQDWFDTGDIMTCRDGNYFILGRMSDAVIGENGENINPDIIEKRFTLPDAAAFSVLGLSGPDGENLSIVVQTSCYLPRERVDAMTEQIYSVNSSLPVASQIRDFFYTHDPISAPGAVKVGRKGLRKAIEDGLVHLVPFSEIVSESGQSSGAESLIMREVRGVISDVLGIEADKIGDNAHVIFELGATSLQYFSILTALAEKFSITSYSDKDNYCYTAKSFCEYIERHI